jgi:hypothetical protein
MNQVVEISAAYFEREVKDTNNCGAIFNLYEKIGKSEKITCPTCLGSISFPNGWRLE